MNSQTEQALRLGFKYFNHYMLLLWRLGLGNWINLWPAVLGRYMVISHTGRKSGLLRHTPVNYSLVNGDLYCIAGFGAGADWYKNLLHNPMVEVWLPDGWWAGEAQDISGDANRIALLRQVWIDSGFVGRLAGLDARQATDEQVAAHTAGYPLVRIRRRAARTGPGGPGELAWVWPLATLFLLMTRRRRRR